MSKESYRLFEELQTILDRISKTKRDDVALIESEIIQVKDSKELLQQSLLRDVNTESQ